MRKLLQALNKNILKIGACFLLFFIPLYPKLPLIDVAHTWVYIRLEDIFIAFIVFIFLLQLLRKRATLATPLSLPIFLYWFIGGLSLAFSLIFLRSQLANFSPPVAFLHFLRRIEYMVLFFIVVSTIKNVKDVYHYLAFFTLGAIGVILYGFGQKFLGFPAFLTMNEEFAKGIPLFLPPEARITSTFGGHYDLAAYLVFALALFGSLIFGVRNWLGKAILLITTFGAYLLLLFTASRISFTVYLVTITFVLLLQKRRWLIIPVILISLFLMKKVSGVSVRFGKTFRVKQVVYDVKTGQLVAPLEEFLITSTPSVSPTQAKIVVKKPPKKEEELPLGTGFLEVPLLEKEASPQALRKVKTIALETATEAAYLATTSGEFLVKRAVVYDIAFTTRFQGTWPRAIKAFKRNIFLGSGYSSISLATDNSYLRALGETGILGLSSFLFILFIILLIARQSLRKLRPAFDKSLTIGIASGIFGLSLNALLIDVFEASKVAYVLWIMVGVMVGLFSISVKRKESLLREATSLLKEPIFAITLLALMTVLFFSSAISNYFTADDFTWLKWSAKTQLSNIPNFFINAKGFFYRPLPKAIFYVSYLFLGLKPHGYHLISFVLHFLNSSIVYFIALFLTKNSLVAFLSSLFFLLHPIHGETVFWISQYSGIFAAFFYFSSFLFFLRWNEKKRWVRVVYYLASLLMFTFSLTSYELAVTLPLILLFYLVVLKNLRLSKGWLLKILHILPYFILLDLYFGIRNIAHAHSLGGDYSYNMENFIFNFFGNMLGYLGEMILGLHFIPLYDQMRTYFRTNRLFCGLILFVVLLVAVFIFRRKRVRLSKLSFFSLGWFILTLLPVIGLGNIAERYLYIPSAGFIMFLSMAIYKFYKRLAAKRGEAFSLMVILLIIFSLTRFYYSELKRSEVTWRDAGETANKILRALSTNYRQFSRGSILYFVNLPLRIKRAWVFPVGIEDGLWFIYKDETLNVIKGNDFEEALDFKEKNQNVYVFVYEEGELREAQRL